MTHLDEAVTGAGGIALRYGGLYGPHEDTQKKAVRKRRYPVIGDGGGITSFIDPHDAAAATLLVLEHDGPAIYNITDDEPTPDARVAARAGGCARRQAAPPTTRSGQGGCSWAMPWP